VDREVEAMHLTLGDTSDSMFERPRVSPAEPPGFDRPSSTRGR